MGQTDVDLTCYRLRTAKDGNRHDIAQLDFKQRYHKLNLTANERDVLASLLNNSDLVIKPADKGGAVVVWCKDLYLLEGQRQLSDRNT